MNTPKDGSLVWSEEPGYVHDKIVGNAADLIPEDDFSLMIAEDDEDDEPRPQCPNCGYELGSCGLSHCGVPLDTPSLERPWWETER